TSRRGTRRAQVAFGGLGKHFESPHRPRDKRKTQRYVEVAGHSAKRRQLASQLEQLLSEFPSSPPINDISDPSDHEIAYEDYLDPTDQDFVPSDSEYYPMHVDDTQLPEEDLHTQCPARNPRLPDLAAERSCSNWKTVIPTLIKPYLHYISRTFGKPVPPLSSSISLCGRFECARKPVNILCLLFDHFTFVEVTSCECSTLPQTLIHFGLFPTAPSQPRMAVSIDMLMLYRALFERSCDAVNALASALHTHYIRRGFRMVNKNKEAVQEPFRRSLGSAVQWYDVLQVQVERQVEASLQACRDRVKTFKDTHSTPSTPHASMSVVTPARSFATPMTPSRPLFNTPFKGDPVASTPATPASSEMPLISRTCAQNLVQRCPACFGGTVFSKSLSEGGDIHVSTDGNFHHRHRRSAGDCPPFYNPAYFLSKTQVDAMGQHIEKQRKKPTKRRNVTMVPDEALDSCESSYEAADGKKQKTSMESFDDTGLMALICRHDIPLFFANIDTPGEQQKYALALITHLFTLLPPHATVVTLYDVGCVLDRTLSLYDIVPDDVVRRLRFVTTAMHAYGHEWACQLVFNPRLSVGLGLSDGEGTERLWSRMIKLIGIERSSSRQRRIWLIDRQATAIGNEIRMDLGDWIKRRLRRGVQDQGKAAFNDIERCGIPVEELRKQWASQREAQLSVRAHAPTRLKKELDAVLALQADIDNAHRAIQAAKTAMDKQDISDDTLGAMQSLERTHDRLMSKVDVLYASLNVGDKFPELQDINLDFVRTLLLARDLKINIRKRAIGSFFEWDKLDQAVGGAQKALGTKLHQQTRKAIAKRQPALMSAIRKYNIYCQQLEALYDPSWSIPLPTPLPTKLNDLRNHQSLMEDVWITPSVGHIPRWMEDEDVRSGIRAMLKGDRCLEEQLRLGMEADNLCRWFGDELATVELALRTPGNEAFYHTLQHHREQLLTLPPRWSNSLASRARFDVRTEDATNLAVKLSGGMPEISLYWINQTTFEALPEEEQTHDNSAEEASAATLDPDQAIFIDYLTEEPSNAHNDDDNDKADKPNIPSVKIAWELPVDLSLDMTPIPILPQSQIDTETTRVRTPRHGLCWITFEPPDIAMLASPMSCINDVCINGCIPLLFALLGVPEEHQYAVFSTFDLPRASYNDNDHLWRVTRHTKFWTKDTWIIPIYRPTSRHWVMCLAHITRRELHLFDSLAEQKPWHADVDNIMKFITRLLSIAKTIYHDAGLDFEIGPWNARPVVIDVLQTNGHDCGIWVLANVAAILRGFDATGLRESDISAFRRYLHSCVLAVL
ncbi:hypothetical protein J3R83DRAFT_13222, partial [Lanmaoa asiatica]